MTAPPPGGPPPAARELVASAPVRAVEPAPAAPLGPAESAIVEAELLAQSIVDAARFEAKRILIAAIDAGEKRGGLARHAESLSAEAIEAMPDLAPPAAQVAAQIRASADAQARAILAQAEQAVAGIEAETERWANELVGRVQRRAARLDRRHRMFRRQARAQRRAELVLPEPLPEPVAPAPSPAGDGPAAPRTPRWRRRPLLAGALAAALAVAAGSLGAWQFLGATPGDATALISPSKPAAEAPPDCPIPQRYQSAFAASARVADIPLPLLAAVAEVESGFDSSVRSSAGAIGVMQLMPETARMLSIDPRNPRQNIRGGALYLRYLIDQLDGMRPALAAYHAGPSALRASTFGPETERYVDSVQRRQRAFGGCSAA